MTHSILHMDTTQVGITTATVAAQPAIWTGVLPTMLAALASLFTIIWMGIQITMAVQDYLDRKHAREIAAANPSPTPTTTVTLKTPDVVVQTTPGGATEVH